MRLLILLLIPSVVLGVPKHRATPIPSPSPTGVVVKQGMVCRTKQQDLELRDWIGGLMNHVHQAEIENDGALKSNAALQTELAASQKAATDLANECAADKACAKAPLSCWFHRLIKHIFWIAGAIVVLLIVLIVINIMTGGALSGFFAIFGAIGRWIAGLFTKKPPVP